MSRYRVWKHSDGLTESVKLGWSWPAFFFGGLWAVAKRMTLLGVCTILGGLLIGYAMEATHLDPDLSLEIGLGAIVSIVYGANGNSWLEKHLSGRGFVPTDTFIEPIIPSWFAHPSGRLKAFWAYICNHMLWSNVIAGIFLIVLTTGVTYFVRRPSSETWSNPAIGQHHFSLDKCSTAVITGHVQPHGVEADVWFEWGETPDLGTKTIPQRFSEETDFYQDLIGLKENTTYYYRASFSNKYGTTVGRVFSFTTARC